MGLKIDDFLGEQHLSLLHIIGQGASGNRKLKKQELNRLIKETHCLFLHDMPPQSN